MARRKKKNQDDSPPGNFDMLFLQLMMIMMAFFILLSSLSVVVEDRRQKALNSLAGAFNLLPSGANLSKGHGQSIPSREIGATSSASMRTAKDLTKVAKILGIGNAIHILPLDKRTVRVRLPERLVFAPGQVRLSPAIIAFLNRLASILRRPEVHEITIEGHTDETPSRGTRYASNWELSAARAMAVFRYLGGQNVAKSRMVVAGMGDAHPLPGDANSRRVEILIRFTPTTSRNVRMISPKTKATSDDAGKRDK